MATAMSSDVVDVEEAAWALAAGFQGGRLDLAVATTAHAL